MPIVMNRAKSPQPTTTSHIATPSGRRILVIDNEPVLRTTFKHLLEAEGFQVWVAADGREGIEIFREVRPDLVITDMVMPQQDGYVTIRCLCEECPGLPIIAMSAVVSPDEIERPLECGAFCYISKPVDMDALCSMIRSILGDDFGGAVGGLNGSRSPAPRGSEP